MIIVFGIITKMTKIKAFGAAGIVVIEVDSIKTANDLRIQWFPVSHCFISFASCVIIIMIIITITITVITILVIITIISIKTSNDLWIQWSRFLIASFHLLFISSSI